jgi:hypothetical protein
MAVLSSDNEKTILSRSLPGQHGGRLTCKQEHAVLDCPKPVTSSERAQRPLRLSEKIEEKTRMANGVGVCTKGVCTMGVAGVGTSKFKLCNWNRRKAKRKATMYPMDRQHGHSFERLGLPQSLAQAGHGDPCQGRAAQSSRKSSRKVRGLIFRDQAKSSRSRIFRALV